jgi:hypothetical protein
MAQARFIGDMFTSNTLEFEENLLDRNLVPIPVSDSHFGILNLRAIHAGHNSLTHEMVFMVDRSASMDEGCGDGKTKMQHICHILKNMVAYFKEHTSIDAFITVCTFDDSCETILERTAVTNTNFGTILATIDNILPRGSTNIACAIEHINQCCSSIRSKFPTHNISSVFMTDGQATTGEESGVVLSDMVDKTFENIFIGVGLDHDGVLLSTLGSGKNSNYYFIDKLENSGFVYGEIIHGVIYTIVNNARITIENGFIYDFKNNVWVTSIDIGNIVGDSSKTYHIATHKPSLCWATISGDNLDGSEMDPISIVASDEFVKLEKYVYRQRTLQHLYNINNFIKSQNQENQHDVFAVLKPPNVEKSVVDERKRIRVALHEFINEMKIYMTLNHLTNDSFMNNLCDDIYICYRTFTTKHASMYAAARQSSQGTQRCYTVNYTPDIDPVLPPSIPRLHRVVNGFPLPPTLMRQNARAILDDDDQPDDIVHIVPSFNDTQSPYRTPSSVTLMRALSGAQQKIESDIEDQAEEL